MKTKQLFAAMLFILMAVAAYAQDDHNSKTPPPPGISAPLTGYVVTSDNENNAYTGTADGDMDVATWNTDPWHPIEFNIFVTDVSVTTAQLSIYAYDVDWGPGAEADEVFLNGHSLGYLTGTSDTWSTSVFNFDPTWVNNVGTNGGKNVVKIMVDQNNPGGSQWVVTVDWGQLVTNLSQGLATFRYVNLDKAQYCANECLVVNEEVDATSPMSVRIETALLNPSNNSIAQDTRTFTATSGDEPFTISSFCLPANPVAGTWKVQAICYDATTNAQMDIRTVSFQVSNPCNPNIPTLTEWGLIILGFVLLGFGTVYILRWRGTSA